MNLRAKPESKFILKYLLIALGLIGFALLSVYDGFVKYPHALRITQAWEKLDAEVEADFRLNDEDKKEQWKAIATENGWSSRIPKRDESSKDIEGKIVYQYFFIALGFGVGIPMLMKYLVTKESWIASTEDGIESSSGAKVKISQIKKFDKARWDKKGIGVLHYQADDGYTKKFVIDDLKYDRETTDKIVQWIESQISAELIVGGAAEPVASPTQNTSQEEKIDKNADPDKGLSDNTPLDTPSA